MLADIRSMLRDPQVLAWGRLANDVFPAGPWESWQDHAECQDYDPELFFPAKGDKGFAAPWRSARPAWSYRECRRDADRVEAERRPQTGGGRRPDG